MSNKHIKPTRAENRKSIASRLILAPELSNRSIARSLGVSHTTVSAIRKELIDSGQIDQLDTHKTSWSNHPYILANPNLLDGASDRAIRAFKAEGILDLMQERELTSPVYAQRILNKIKKAQEQEVYTQLSYKDCTLFCADIRDGLNEIPDKTIDLILVDPPYALDYVDLLKHLGEVANRVLCDDGNLLVMYGNRHLPKAMQLLSESMEYYWTLSYPTPSSSAASLQYLRVYSGFKPILWFRKKSAPKYTGSMVYDVIKDTGKLINTTDKTHKWEQSCEGWVQLIEQFTKPGCTVLDPMCGSSSTGEVALSLGRKYIGCDIDTNSIELSCTRLSKLLEQKQERPTIT